MEQEIIYTRDWVGPVFDAIAELVPDKAILITDTNVDRDVLTLQRDRIYGAVDDIITISSGESAKNLDTLAYVWKRLADAGCTRHSLVINFGGGVVSDLGGFAAATFKRGIQFVNVPTTLLAMADAAIGGKTGIDFAGYKNEVGAFAPACRVIMDEGLLSTLPERELRSGFAEVVKMALILNDPIYDELIKEDALHDSQLMRRAIKMAADGKLLIVNSDPYEKGARRMLNFGHTAGHAFESYAESIGKPISHGEAVAYGMLVALRLSCDRNGYPVKKVDEYEENILKRYYEPLPFGEEAEPELQRLMAHDKKNIKNGEINWVLLK